MGCVQGKSSAPENLDRLKRENGYVKGIYRTKLGGVNNLANDSGNLLKYVEEQRMVCLVKDGGRRKVGFTEAEKEKNVGGDGNASDGESNKTGGDLVVDCWPKWFVDNIPREDLAGLVLKSADSYDKIAKVGQGTYSNVYKARDRGSGKIVALKKVRFETSELESIKFMAREIVILQKLNHPNIIKLEGIVISRMQYSLYLVFDFMQSDLTRIISRQGERLSEAQVKCYMQQLLSGLQHCHEKGILHRDIKPSNILIDKSGMLKIADFGLANFFRHPRRKHLTNRVVTLWYRAPELLLGSTDYGVCIDLWSAGCLLAEMFVGRPIMPGRTEVEQLHRIFKLCGSPPEDYWKRNKLPASFRPPRVYEPSFQESFSGFPASSFGLLTSLLSLEPEGRGTAASALQNEFFSSPPLACDISELPFNYKEEDHSNSRKKHKKSKRKKSPHTKEAPSGVDFSKKDGGFDSFKEDNNQLTSLRRITSNSSSSFNPFLHREGLPRTLSPLLQFSQKTMAKTEGHPNALKNIKNYSLLQASTLLQASVTDIINPKEGNPFSHMHRSLSTVDLRSMDIYKMPKPPEPDTEEYVDKDNSKYFHLV